MTDAHEGPDPWAGASLPAGFDAREIYEFAIAAGAERRGQRRRRQLVLTVCGCLVVALTAAGIALSGNDGGETRIQLAAQPSVPHAPARHAATAPHATPHRRAPARRKAAALPAPPLTSECRAFAGSASSISAKLSAFHAAGPTVTTTTDPVEDTTTSTITTVPPETTTTTNPPTTTPPTTRHTTPPTHIRVSHGTVTAPPPVIPGGAPVSPQLVLPPRRTRC